MLHTAPSLSVYNSTDGFEGEEKEGGVREEIVKMGSVEFSFGEMGMGIEEKEEEDDEEEEREIVGGFEKLGTEENSQPASPRMYLATGLGIEGGDGLEFKPPPVSVDGSSGCGSEEYYKRMVDEYPCHPLFLRNYAQLLQSKGDLHGAEDYYYRATLADPGDGEVISQYAILVWELHRNQDRTFDYFERALEVAPDDCHILAAYASFLWEIEDNVEEDSTQKSHIQIEEEEGANELHKAGLGIDMARFSGGTGGVDAASEGGNIEEYYKKMAEENPSNPQILGNYALFLYQIKEDPLGAEQYYSRAILADPGDGEIMSQYAKLVWELHHDLDKASFYFERAVEASPEDCNVLAAHASFLWETEEEEEEPIARQVQGDLQGAEEHFSNAILADPRDGEIMSQYAKFLWEQHHDRDKASFYFERAVEATPGDWYEYSPELPHVHIKYISYESVLAARASFLWETEEDEEGPAWKEHVQSLQGEAVMT